jgi:hypothetical protein
MVGHKIPEYPKVLIKPFNATEVLSWLRPFPQKRVHSEDVCAPADPPSCHT